MLYVRFASALAVLVSTACYSAGLARNENFIVLTPAKPSQEQGEQYAELVLKRANEFRAEFAKEWFGTELAAGEGRTIISINFSNNENSGLTWAKDHPDRRFHNIYLTTSADNASGSILHHEIAHSVMATYYPHPSRLPTWIEEGIASRYDNQSLIDAREQVIRTWLRQGRVPSLATLFNSTNIKSFDDDSYAASTSLVSFLLTRGDKRTLLKFAEDGQQYGWAESLNSHYGIDGLAQLQVDWQQWLVGSQVGG